MAKSSSITKISGKAGLPSGTPLYVGDVKAKPTNISIVDYNERTIEVKQVTDIKECFLYKDTPNITWINISGFLEVDKISELCAYYGLHHLTIEDILNTEQRPKCDIFDDYVFVSLKKNIYEQKTLNLTVQQISIVFGKNFVLTFQEEQSNIFDFILERLQKAQNKIRQSKADYLAYALIDVIVDSYFEIFEVIGNAIEDIEECVTSAARDFSVESLHNLKRKIILLRKSLWPAREVISMLQRKLTDLIEDKTIFYLKDTGDHIVQLIDTSETYRDLLASLLDIYMSTVSNRMNEIMKVLTMFATIFIPLTFIAGLYGMNFNPSKSPFNMPELNWYFGYPFALSLMLIVVIVMLIFFKRKKWF
jgi:magnesium transporter